MLLLCPSLSVSPSGLLRQPQVYMALAELEVEVGDVEKARATFQEALAKCMQDTHKLLVAWAKLEEENFGDWDKATELLLRASEVGCIRYG